MKYTILIRTHTRATIGSLMPTSTTALITIITILTIITGLGTDGMLLIILRRISRQTQPEAIIGSFTMVHRQDVLQSLPRG